VEILSTGNRPVFLLEEFFKKAEDIHRFEEGIAHVAKIV